MSAPTVRFLRAIQQLRLLPATHRRKVAATVYAEIRPLFGSRDVELRRAARRAQDERWQLIYRDIREMTDARFASVVLTEQWVLASLELVLAASPVAEVLAEKRCGAVETFIGDNLSFENCEVIQLHAHVSSRRIDRGNASKNAA